jgi:hypothetical protein
MYQLQPGAQPHKRRRGRTIALVLVMAALVGGGGAAAMRYADNWRQSTDDSTGTGGTAGSQGGATGKPGGQATDDGSGTAAGTLPANWVPKKDPDGFSLALPSKKWKRQPSGSQVDYTPDGGKHFVRFAVDDSPDFPDPYSHQLDLEQQLTKLQDYARVSLKANTFRDCHGSLWDFTWTALPKQTPFPGQRRAIEQTYLGRDGVEYAIYMSSPAADWDTALQQFKVILRSWSPKA